MEQYEEISLKKLILLLLKGWKIIFLSTVVLLLIGLGVYNFGNQTTLSLSSTAQLSYFPSYITAYGTFNSGLEKGEDVLNLIEDDFYKELQDVTSYEFPVDQLKPYVSFSVSAPNTLKITYTGLDETSLQNLQSNVSHSLSIYLSTSLQDKAQQQFLLALSNSSIQAALDIKKNEELIALFEAELSQTDMLLSSNLINPAYASLASRIQDLKNTNLILNYTSTLLAKQIEELNTLDHEDTLPFIGIYADITNDNTVISSQQFNIKTLIPISLVLGMMVGIFIVLFMNYWKNTK